MTDELLTVDQASERLQMHPDTVRRLLREGQLPGRKIGARQWRIPAGKLKAYVDSEPRLGAKEEGRRSASRFSKRNSLNESGRLLVTKTPNSSGTSSVPPPRLPRPGFPC